MTNHYVIDGMHIMNVQIQYAPFNVKGGWESRKEECINNVMSTIRKIMLLNIRSVLKNQEFISPNDIEKQFYVSGGHWHHGEIQIDQLFMLSDQFLVQHSIKLLLRDFICVELEHILVVV